jgi:c-di-GMP-binding flagellar brake protein YcgR
VPDHFHAASDFELKGSSGPGVTPLAESADFVARRRWPRYCVGMAVQVRVKTQGPTRVATWQGHGTDISAGGLAVTVDSDLPIGSQIAVEFTLPGSDQPMSFRCFVRNREGDRYGVEFITENDDDYRTAAELQALLAAMKTG